MKEEKRMKEKKIPVGREGFPRVGPTLLVGQWVAALRSIKG
jgi:hypothetical protein